MPLLTGTYDEIGSALNALFNYILPLWLAALGVLLTRWYQSEAYARCGGWGLVFFLEGFGVWGRVLEGFWEVCGSKGGVVGLVRVLDLKSGEKRCAVHVRCAHCRRPPFAPSRPAPPNPDPTGTLTSDTPATAASGASATRAAAPAPARPTPPEGGACGRVGVWASERLGERAASLSKNEGRTTKGGHF